MRQFLADMKLLKIAKSYCKELCKELVLSGWVRKD